ncbi:MAG: hypothetical protein WBQ10_00565 [Terriglobales bacterium]
MATPVSLEELSVCLSDICSNSVDANQALIYDPGDYDTVFFVVVF